MIQGDWSGKKEKADFERADEDGDEEGDDEHDGDEHIDMDDVMSRNIALYGMRCAIHNDAGQHVKEEHNDEQNGENDDDEQMKMCC